MKHEGKNEYGKMNMRLSWKSLYKTRLYTANAINQELNQAYHARTWHSMTESLTDNPLIRKLQVHGHDQHGVPATE